MGSPCLFTRQQALKMGYFYWLRVKSSNHLHTELNLGYLKGTKFCLENTASFIDISSIASFKPFLIAWLREYCAFSDSSVANLKPYWKVRISYAEVLRHSFWLKIRYASWKVYSYATCCMPSPHAIARTYERSCYNSSSCLTRPDIYYGFRSC